MAAGVQLTVRRAQEDVIARPLLHLLFFQSLYNIAHRRDPLPVEDRRVARGFPVMVRKAQRIAMGIDLPFALENPGTLIVARIADILAVTRRADVEGISVRIDIDEFELPPDHPRDHLLQRRVLLTQLHVGPHLRPRVAEPHGRNVARVDVGIGIAVRILAVVHRGVERVGEAVGEHPPQAFVGQKTAHAGDLPFHCFRLKKPLFLRGPLVGVRLRFVGAVPHLGSVAHLEAQLPALHHVGMTDPRLRVGLTIEPHPLDIFVRSGVVFGRDREHTARDLHFGPVEERRSEPVASARRLGFVHAQRREDVPRRHLTHILVARQSVRPVVVERREHLADLVGRLPRLPQHRIEVQNMVARFVAVGVLADQSRDVGRGLAAFDDRTYRKQRIEFFNHLRTRAEQPFEALDIVRSQPGVLPGVALAVVVGAVRRGERIEGRPPALPRIPAPHEARRRVEIVAVAMAALLEILRILRLAQRFGGTRRRAVGQSVLHVIGYGLVEHLARDVAVLHAQAVAPVGVHGRLTDRLEGLFAVEAPDALHDGVRHRYDARVAHHAVRLVAPQVPYREPSLLVGDVQHRLDDVGHPLRVQDGHQRHRGPVSVPQRKGRIGIAPQILMHLAVGSAVIAVHIAEERRSDHRMVKGRIENPAGRLVRGLDLHLRQFIVPRLVGSGRRSVEIPSGEFRRKVCLRAFDTYGRKGHFHEHLFALRRVEVHTCITGRDPGHFGIVYLARLQVGNPLRGF